MVRLNRIALENCATQLFQHDAIHQYLLRFDRPTTPNELPISDRFPSPNWNSSQQCDSTAIRTDDVGWFVAGPCTRWEDDGLSIHTRRYPERVSG